MRYCSLQHQTLFYTTRYFHNWVSFLLWPSNLVLSRAISNRPLLFPSILDTFQLGGSSPGATSLLNIDVLGMSELKWMGISQFNSDGHCEPEFLRRNEIVFIVNRSPKCSVLVQSQKPQNDLSSLQRQTIQHHNSQRPRPLTLKRLKLTDFKKTYRPSRTSQKKQMSFSS